MYKIPCVPIYIIKLTCQCLTFLFYERAFCSNPKKAREAMKLQDSGLKATSSIGHAQSPGRFFFFFSFFPSEVETTTARTG